MLTNLQATTIDHFGFGLGAHIETHRVAAKLFEKVHLQALRDQVLSKLGGKSQQLLTLAHSPQLAACALGTVVVPLEKIVGSEGRRDDFDASFRPLKKHLSERWISIAAARRAGVVLPAVELVQDGEVYYVRDGHHRISVARALGQLEIDARVVN